MASEKPSQPCSSFVNPQGEDLLHRAILCTECGWPFGEHGSKVWVEPETQHAFYAKPPTIQTIEYARVDPPAAPTDWHPFLQYPLGKFRNPKDDTGKCWFVTNHHYCRLPADAAIHAAPPAPSEADKALAREIIGNVNSYAEEHTGELSISAFGPLSKRIAAALAQARKEGAQNERQRITKAVTNLDWKSKQVKHRDAVLAMIFLPDCTCLAAGNRLAVEYQNHTNDCPVYVNAQPASKQER